MFMYAAFMLFGGTDVLKVTINVFDGSILSFLFVMMCFTSVTPWVLKASRTSASSQSRNSRQRMTPREEFRERWGVTEMGTSIHVFIANALFPWCFETTSNNTDQFASFLPLATSPTAHFRIDSKDGEFDRFMIVCIDHQKP